MNLQIILLGSMAACHVYWKERMLSDSFGVLQVNIEVGSDVFFFNLVALLHTRYTKPAVFSCFSNMFSNHEPMWVFECSTCLCWLPVRHPL